MMKNVVDERPIFFILKTKTKKNYIILGLLVHSILVLRVQKFLVELTFLILYYILFQFFILLFFFLVLYFFFLFILLYNLLVGIMRRHVASAFDFKSAKLTKATSDEGF